MAFNKISRKQYELDEVYNYIPYEDIKLPKRATVGSAGYDIYSVCDFTLNPGEEIKLPTGINIDFEGSENFFLMIVPRSGIGTRTCSRLANSVGVVDSDYFYSDNEGHIWVKLFCPVNGHTLEIKQGEAICQGIILPFETFTNEDTDFQVRNGGFGSTSR